MKKTIIPLLLMQADSVIEVALSNNAEISTIQQPSSLPERSSEPTEASQLSAGCSPGQITHKEAHINGEDPKKSMLLSLCFLRSLLSSFFLNNMCRHSTSCSMVRSSRERFTGKK